MNIISLMMAVMLSGLALLMFAASIITPSPLKVLAVLVTGIMFLMTLAGIRIIFLECKDDLFKITFKSLLRQIKRNSKEK